MNCRDYNFTYIVACSDNTLYTGWTNNIKERIKRHNEKKGAKYTKARTPVELVYLEVSPTKQNAMQREAAIKKLSRRQKEKLIQDISLDEILKQYQIEMVEENEKISGNT